MNALLDRNVHRIRISRIPVIRSHIPHVNRVVAFGKRDWQSEDRTPTVASSQESRPDPPVRSAVDRIKESERALSNLRPEYLDNATSAITSLKSMCEIGKDIADLAITR